MPCPPPGDLPDPGMEPASLALPGGFFNDEPPGKPVCLDTNGETEEAKKPKYNDYFLHFLLPYAIQNNVT